MASSILKIYVDYPCEVEIDYDRKIFLKSGYITRIELCKGQYHLGFILDGVNVIEEISQEIPENNCEYLLFKKFVKYPLFSFVEGHSNFPYAVLFNKKLALWNGKYALTKAIYDDICDTRINWNYPYVVSITNKEGLLSEYGDVLLECKYDKLLREGAEPGNVELFNQFLLFIHTGRKTEKILKWEKTRNIKLDKTTNIDIFLNLMPIFYVCIVQIENNVGAIGIGNEIFVPVEFDSCEFLNLWNLTGNWLGQDCKDNEVLTRSNAETLLFKVQRNGMWNIYEAKTGLISEKWLTEDELKLMLNPSQDEYPF